MFPPKTADLRGVHNSPSAPADPPWTPSPATGTGPLPGQNETTRIRYGRDTAADPRDPPRTLTQGETQCHAQGLGDSLPRN